MRNLAEEKREHPDEQYFCSKCGTENYGYAYWCINCGEYPKPQPNHIRCHRCGKFLKKELWVPKNHPFRCYVLCEKCYSNYF